MRGDGRTYGLGLQKNYKKSHAFDMAMGLTANDQYHYPLFTRGGPYWQVAKVPLLYLIIGELQSWSFHKAEDYS